MRPPQVVAAAAAAAFVAAIAVLAFSLLPDLLVWAAFIGWASYDHSGANSQALLRSSAGLVFGVVMAWIVVIAVASGSLSLGVLPATAVSAAIASFVIVLASCLPLLSIVPAAFYGFASTFAYASLVPVAFAFGPGTMPDARNALVVLPASLLIGTALGPRMDGWRRSSPRAQPRRCQSVHFASTARP